MSKLPPPPSATDGVAEPVDGTHAVRKNQLRLLVEWVALLTLALLVAVGLRTYAFQTFYIPSGSMMPTLQVGDRIVVDKFAIDFGTIHRGDILVFKAPPTLNCGEPSAVDLVKRVVGLPGDSLYSIGNTVYVNHRVLREKWGHFEPLTPPIASVAEPVVVAANHYFMMGDNHPNSCDSRIWGTISRSDVIGKAFFRLWPLRRLGAL